MQIIYVQNLRPYTYADASLSVQLLTAGLACSVPSSKYTGGLQYSHIPLRQSLANK